MKKNVAWLTLSLSLLATSPALAGGYDTPILYSARHMGMGGTAQGYVDDPSSLFHNPAGLGNTKFISVLGDFSLLLGSIQGSPSASADANQESKTTVAPFFLVGGAFRVHDNITLGLAVYPVASAGAEYEYENIVGDKVFDHTKLVFIELAPGVAVNLPYGINLGASYRVTYASLTREQKVGDDPVLDLALKGLNFASFRLGAQWKAIEVNTVESGWDYRRLGFGLMYRHQTKVDMTADEGVALAFDAENIETTFTLPSRLVFGTRGDWGRAGLAVDMEYGFNSQNDKSTIAGECAEAGGCASVDEGDTLAADNVFDWKDAVTLRVGAEYRLLEKSELAARVGYVFDATTANKAYPTAFGTPPGPTHSFTLGCGYDGGPWEANVAYAFRTGSAEVKASDKGSRACAFCSEPGDYKIQLHGIYADFSYDFE